MNRRIFLGAGLSLLAAPAFARNPKPRPRILSFHHLHTDERLHLIYRVGDDYQRSALNRLNQFLRDFRTGDAIAMDPKLFDLLYDLRQSMGADEATIEVISAYRSPRTNDMLRRTSAGVARHSLHLSGRAIDIRLTGTRTAHIRDAALALAQGGVGYYPKADFVHLDTGAVRYWGA